jgi:hypothetical protein
MKKLDSFLSATLLCLTMATTARASVVSGIVQCDANQNGTNDIGDIGIANAMVVVVNQNHSFSNFTFTAADGSFSLQIPNFDPYFERQDPLSQVYEESVNAATLPPGSTILSPVPITYIHPYPAFYIDFAADLTNVVYTSGTGTFSTGNWLLSNPSCQSSACGISGSGIIRGSSKRADDSFGGTISLKSLPNGTRRGHWTHVAHRYNLLFQSTVVQTVSCGGSPANAIEFSGLGKLKGIGRNRARYSPVYFTVRAEDHGPRGRGLDRYYLHVYSPDGATLLLVSGDPSNPADIATIPLSAGNLTIGASHTR